ncbi:MAG: hypothetical protein GX945_05135 [Lentisphaerae bacterium]|nr:hypothetical protein [Lentisphaerota bacterium]
MLHPGAAGELLAEQKVGAASLHRVDALAEIAGGRGLLGAEGEGEEDGSGECGDQAEFFNDGSPG